MDRGQSVSKLAGSQFSEQITTCCGRCAVHCTLKRERGFPCSFEYRGGVHIQAAGFALRLYVLSLFPRHDVAAVTIRLVGMMFLMSASTTFFLPKAQAARSMADLVAFVRFYDEEGFEANIFREAVKAERGEDLE